MLDPDDPIAEAARQALAFHYERMVANEPGTRAGEEIEGAARYARRHPADARRLLPLQALFR